MAHVGRCLCGGIRFEVGAAKAAAHCHCSYCRLSGGAAFVTWVVVEAAAFRIVSGEGLLRWRHSSAPSERGFCTECGSTLFFRSRLCPGEVHVTRANLPDDFPATIAFHCFVEQEVPWVHVTDELTRLRGDGAELARYQQIPPP
jgi:hypothetical protein